jgi:SP family galactose:H+ symporter-like MFS transporter
MTTTATDETAAEWGGPPSHRRMIFGKFGFWLAMVGLMTMLAGLLFGYDQGVISGALQFITKEFNLSTTMQQVVTSWVTLGALVGALAAGVLADRIGRKRTNILAALLFMIGAAIEAFTPGTAVLVVGRFVVGFGVGMASVAAPLYAAEVAPAKTRGRFVSTYQLAITIGILIAYIIDDLLTPSGSWRVMLGLAIVPGALLAIVVLVMPESPRWLMKMGRRKEASDAVTLVDGNAGATEHLDSIQRDLDAEGSQASWGEVFAKSMRKPLMVGVGLAVFQQITGINAIIYYANEIFAEAGFTTPEQQAKATLYAVGAVNVLATFIAVAYVDRFGRRPLLLAGLVGMTVSLATVGFSFWAFDEHATTNGPSTTGIITVISLVVFIASFAFSMGPITWTVINEIFPNRVRGRAVAVATAVNWGAAFLVSEFFLTLVDAIGTAATFWLFALAGAVAYVWVWKRVPETKGRTLEEITAIWSHDDVVAHTTADD